MSGWRQTSASWASYCCILITVDVSPVGCGGGNTSWPTCHVTMGTHTIVPWPPLNISLHQYLDLNMNTADTGSDGCMDNICD